MTDWFNLPGDPSLPPGTTRGMIDRHGCGLEENDDRLHLQEDAEVEADEYEQSLDDLDDTRDNERAWAAEVERLAGETAARARTMGEAA